MFWQGFRFFWGAVRHLTSDERLRPWFWKSLLRTSLLALFLIFLFLGVGSWVLNTQIENSWVSGVASILCLERILKEYKADDVFVTHLGWRHALLLGASTSLSSK